jgi:hypothetical protein
MLPIVMILLSRESSSSTEAMGDDKCSYVKRGGQTTFTLWAEVLAELVEKGACVYSRSYMLLSYCFENYAVLVFGSLITT